MPRTYATCRPGAQRYEVKTESMGKPLLMCRALGSNDNLVRVGRRTRCFDPTKDGSKRKTCQILVPHSFATIVPPSYYTASELQRAKISYGCSNQNMLLMAPFDGQGDDFNVHHSADHIVVGPIHLGDSWRVVCMDPSTLLPHGAPADWPLLDQTFDRPSTLRAMPMLKYIPNAAECDDIIGRWNEERRFICRSDQRNLLAAMAAIRGLIHHNFCADHLFEPVRTIVAAVDTPAKRRLLLDLCHALWNMGMYSRRWTGPGNEYPLSEGSSQVLVTSATVSSDLDGQKDPVTSVPLDAISTVASEGTAGLLANAMRMHARRASELLDDRSWLANAEAEAQLRDLRSVSQHVHALVPRGLRPTRFVHALLPSDVSKLRDTVQSCLGGNMCIRMGSGRLILTAVMLHFAMGSTARDAPWTQQTAAQGDPILLLDRLANIV